MTETYGKLTLTLPGGVEQEFTLEKANITLGRALTNDIVLPDPRVSREHARLECGAEGCSLVDLGSANKTRVNGVIVERTQLAPGDLIAMGESNLQFTLTPVREEPAMTLIDTEDALDATLAEMTLSVALNDTDTPRLAVHTPQGTWELPFTGEVVSIGRHSSNDVVIDHPKVSREHARIERTDGDDFILQDLNSTNGTWVRGDRVDRVALQDGDLVKIGDAQLVFKRGFTSADMTLLDGDLKKLSAHRPVVFVPGLMGSELWLGDERVWPNIKLMIKNPEIFRLPAEVPLEPRGVMNEIVIVPNLVKIEQCNRLGDYLVEELGYQREVDYLEFAYDWRYDVRRAARKLAEAIDNWGVSLPITLIGYSLGTLVSRYYVEHYGGKSKVERLILLGGPHHGVPKAATSLLLGPKILPFGMMGERLRDVVATFESNYQILPTYPCIFDQHGQEINILEDESWIADDQRPLLRTGREFRRELGTHSSVPAISVFGYGLKTITKLNVQRDGQGQWTNVDYETSAGGDYTVPELSAVLEGTEIHPVKQYHSALYVDKDVKMRLKHELTR